MLEQENCDEECSPMLVRFNECGRNDAIVYSPVSSLGRCPKCGNCRVVAENLGPGYFEKTADRAGYQLEVERMIGEDQA